MCARQLTWVLWDKSIHHCHWLTAKMCQRNFPFWWTLKLKSNSDENFIYMNVSHKKQHKRKGKRKSHSIENARGRFIFDLVLIYWLSGILMLQFNSFSPSSCSCCWSHTMTNVNRMWNVTETVTANHCSHLFASLSS